MWHGMGRGTLGRDSELEWELSGRNLAGTRTRIGTVRTHAGRQRRSCHLCVAWRHELTSHPRHKTQRILQLTSTSHPSHPSSGVRRSGRRTRTRNKLNKEDDDPSIRPMSDCLFRLSNTSRQVSTKIHASIYLSLPKSMRKVQKYKDTQIHKYSYEIRQIRYHLTSQTPLSFP